MNALGMHLLLEMQGCTASLLDDAVSCRRILYDIARKSGMTPLKDTFQTFTPQGFSGVVLLAESHVSIHTWPEFGYAAVDFFTCNMATDMDLVERLFIEAFQPSDLQTKLLYRGDDVLVPHEVRCAEGASS